MSSLQKSVLKSKLPPLPSMRSKKARGAMGKRDYTPLQWDKYFSAHRDIAVAGRGTFRVYTLGDAGPALVLLHGGGLSALTWAHFAVALTKLVECQVVAIDLRGHGSSTTVDDLDLSAATLAEDIGGVVKSLWGDEAPAVVLMGHSMGGAIGVHAAVAEQVPTLSGLVVIDVVEGTAMEALSSMQSFLRGRPKTFRSLEEAIEWSVRSGQVRNVDSARVSMPGQISNIETLRLAAEDIADYVPICSGDSAAMPDPNLIAEETESAEAETDEVFKVPTPAPEAPKPKYTWRVDLSKSESHWPGWFVGMSKLFLSVEAPKLLLLAGIDTLDRELMVGQMQGSFQLQVLPKCGHAVHEDVPDEVAHIMAAFLVRLKLAQPTADFVPSMPAC